MLDNVLVHADSDLHSSGTPNIAATRTTAGIPSPTSNVTNGSQGGMPHVFANTCLRHRAHTGGLCILYVAIYTDVPYSSLSTYSNSFTTLSFGQPLKELSENFC